MKLGLDVDVSLEEHIGYFCFVYQFHADGVASESEVVRE